MWLYFTRDHLTTIHDIGAKYCTEGCENWVPLVTLFYRDELGGNTADLGFSGGPHIAESPWPMFGHDPQHTGQSLNIGPKQQYFIHLVKDLESTIISSPIINNDGTIYLTTINGRFNALQPDGTLTWSYGIGGLHRIWQRQTPAIGPDGTLYAVFIYEPQAWYGRPYIVAISPEGNIKWHYETDFTSGEVSDLVVDRSGNIYFCTNPYIIALNPDGTEKWRYDLGINFIIDISIDDKDGTIYIGMNNGLIAIDPTGSEKWFFPTSGYVTKPAIGVDRTIYILSINSDFPWTQCQYTIYSIDKNGTKNFQYEIIENQVIGWCPSYSAISIAKNNNIYFSTNTRLYNVSEN
jgi:hypothetical protein